MDTKTLAPKRSVIYLNPYVRNSINETPYFCKTNGNDSDKRNGASLSNLKRYKPSGDSDKSSSNQPEDASEYAENGAKRGPGGSKRINREISNALKKKVNKHIGGQFEYSKRLFVSTLWAYLDIEDSAKIDDDKFNCFRLLFGPENIKHKLFNIGNKSGKSTNNLKNNKITKNGNSNHVEEMEDITSDTKSSTTSSSENEMESPVSHNTSEAKQLNDSDKASKSTNFDYFLDKSYPLSPEFKLLRKCNSFFERHGLVTKVRKLPLDSFVDVLALSRRTSRIPITTPSYPSYHFISRQRRHMIEQVIRSKSFLETEFNRHSDPRNSRSPFSLFETHPKTLSYLQDVVNDLNDQDFTDLLYLSIYSMIINTCLGLFISVSTKPFKSNTQFGKIKRTKLVAWGLVEILETNERSLKCIWVNPLISANGTTDLLRSFLPFIIMSSFSVRPPEIDFNHKMMFYSWLSDFDLFPRQTLVLLTSPYRFALEKHYDCSERTQIHTCSTHSVYYGTYLYEHNSTDNPNSEPSFSSENDDLPEEDEYQDAMYRNYLSEYKSYISNELKMCKCHENPNWNDLDQVLFSCTERTFLDSIPRWLQLIKRTRSKYLENDIQRVVTHENCDIESPQEIRAAEFAGLDNKHIQDLMANLYGSKWTHRFKQKYVKIFKSEDHITKNYNQSEAEAVKCRRVTHN
uniref:Uncharacterized protein n=1 Tax=Theileria annulata TaxID=5874 RepID=A0A3B0MI76_THEAN